MKLKPCPFCGSTDVFLKNPELPNYDLPSIFRYSIEILCPKCEFGIHYAYCSNPDDAKALIPSVIKKWNRRA